MPAAILRVHCANCYRRVLDEGTGNTCEYCGCYPLPSYSYPKTSSFHPATCKCIVNNVPNVNIKPRMFGEPKLKL